MKKTLVLGASTNSDRYSNAAVHRLLANGHDVVPVGIKSGEIAGLAIQQGEPAIADVDTVTLYLNPEHQKSYYDYLLNLKPKRIIFNPGTENPELMRLAQEHNIEVEIACTLVMLSLDVF
ncbi:MAG TPA: CoA-binding protein [Saprospiraceae bacterium]|nr:CoA-binding protein [Saprospiraceae bacterium]HMQ84225.1 CoA-binding protein [Saprospiraceae bacterium]